MALLSRDAILTSEDIETQDVSVPEWGGEIRLRALSIKEWERYQQRFVTVTNGKTKVNLLGVRASLIAASAVDESGRRLFTTADVEALASKSAKAIERVYDAAVKLSKVDNSDVEVAAQDFETTQDED